MAKYKIFFGTYSKGEGNGIFGGVFDSDSGEIKITDTLDIENPAYLRLDPSNNNRLYGVSELTDGEVFAVNISDPENMRLADIKPTHGKHPCHLCVKDKFIFTANYSEGSLNISGIDESGYIKPFNLSIQHFGRSMNPSRQTQPHVHFADMTPDGKYLAVCDLGLDKVFLYPYCSEKGISVNAKIIDCPPGAGPRHLTFSKCGEYMYLLTELANTVLVYEYNGGDVELIQEISTLPADFTDQSTAAAIHIPSNGEFLAASNRGHDSIAIFKIKTNGKLDFLYYIEDCEEPRDFRFSPDSQWLLIASQKKDCVRIYPTGFFVPAGKIRIPKPVCILFGEEI